jgi:hypothetical protein
VSQVTCRIHERQTSDRAAGNRHADVQVVVLGDKEHAVAGQNVVECQALPEGYTVACDKVLNHAHSYWPIRMTSATVPCGTRSSSGNACRPRSSDQRAPTSSGWRRDLPRPVLSTAEK